MWPKISLPSSALEAQETSSNALRKITMNHHIFFWFLSKPRNSLCLLSTSCCITTKITGKRLPDSVEEAQLNFRTFFQLGFGNLGPRYKLWYMNNHFASGNYIAISWCFLCRVLNTCVAIAKSHDWTNCYGLSICCFQNLRWNFNPNVAVLRGGAFKRWLDHEGSAQRLISYHHRRGTGGFIRRGRVTWAGTKACSAPSRCDT